MLEVDGKKLNESLAIMRYAARESGKFIIIIIALLHSQCTRSMHNVLCITLALFHD